MRTEGLDSEFWLCPMAAAESWLMLAELARAHHPLYERLRAAWKRGCSLGRNVWEHRLYRT